MQHVTVHSWSSYKIIIKNEKQPLLVLMHVDIHGAAAACEPTDPNSLMKHLHRSKPSRPWWCGLRLFPVMSLSFHFTGPPVNVTCNIFINSHRDNHGEFLWHLGWFLQCVNVLSIPQPAGPPVNVTCNIFINSFGSIAETTMVSWALCLDMFLKPWPLIRS